MLARERPVSNATQTVAGVLHSTVQRLTADEIADARIEAEILVMHALGVGREGLYTRLKDAVDPSILASVSALLERRLAREPAAYITQQKEFYALDLRCTPDALIPRPETELLVDLVLEHIGSKEAVVVDVGAGTGAIGVAIARNAPRTRVIATDVSRPALRLARENAQRHGISGRIDFLQGALLAPLRVHADIIVANLPYISDSEYERLAPEIRQYEPRSALHAGERGTELIEGLLDQAPALLAPGGLLIAEHAHDQGASLRAYARRTFPVALVETKRDLAGLDRALVVRTSK